MIQVLDIYYGNPFDIDKEIATGTDAVIIRGGQGPYSDLPRNAAERIKECKERNMPYGIFWHIDARFSPQAHIDAIKKAFPDADFGPLGLWLDCEKPSRKFPDRLYGLLPYAYYKPIIIVWQAILDWTGKLPGIYTNRGFWDLAFGKIPDDVAKKLAESHLWVAQYKTSQPDLFGFWSNWTLWQYQEGPDFSVFNGTDEEWAEFSKGIFVPPPPPPIPSPVTSVEITVISDKAELQKVIVDGSDVTEKANLHTIPFPVSPSPELGLYYILNDWQMPEKYWGGKSRTARKGWKGHQMTPETVRLHGIKSTTILSKESQDLVRRKNPGRLFKYVTKRQQGWCNFGKWPKVETLTFSNNMVDVIKIEGNRAYIRTWNGEEFDPCVIHKWVNVDRWNNLYDTGRGQGFIVLAYKGPVWIELDKLVKI
jgi:hypothetical protein